MRSAVVPAMLPGRQPGEGFGLGVRVATDPSARNTLVAKGSFGWSGAFGTHFWVDPEQQIVGILMAQHLSPIALLDEISGEFETAVMQAFVAGGR